MTEAELLGVLLVVALVLRRRERAAELPSSGWVFPVPDLEVGDRHYAASISNEFSPPHPGVDVLYRVGSRWNAPAGTPVLAARVGVVERVTQTARGWALFVRHGGQLATLYLHLERVDVANGQHVDAGEQLGLMGADPTDHQGLRHLHFELWQDGAPRDPTLEMRRWSRRSRRE
jgi:murein DD-endopeptidase MepM/ murein hydrolase activator NlpD